jgi:hypothetical protein
MTRTHIESLLASFPKLIPTNSQHTSVETAQVRYVYQPLEDLYILLITNKASNILQDIDTLHLFARVVSDICRTADEREIQKQSFELLGAFDEIVSMGYREQVNLIQVRSILEMESHEEKIQDIIARVSAHPSDYPTPRLFNDRIKKQRQKKNSNAVRGNSSSSVGSSKSVLQYPAVGAAHISVEACLDTLLFLNASTLQRCQRLALHRLHLRPAPAPLRLRAVA